MKRDVCAGLVLFLGVLFYYLRAMCPDVFVGDSGEFLTTSAVLGVAHSPGYPLYSLLGKAYVILFPFGSIGYRINFFTVFFAAAGIFAFFLVLRRSLGVGAAAALFASVFLALNKEYFSNALNAEVFTLNAFFGILIAWAAFETAKLDAKPRPGLLIIFFAYLLGVALGNHHTIIFMAPGFIAAAYIKASDRGVLKVLKDVLIPSILFGLTGLSVYIFILIRADIQPPLNWGQADDLGRLWRLFTRADYGSFSLSLGDNPAFTSANLFAQAWRYVKNLAGSFGIFAFSLGLFGWVVWFLKSRRTFYPGMVFFIVTGLVFFLMGNMPFDAQSEGILGRFYILSAVIFALSLGFGVDYLIKAAKYPALVICAAAAFGSIAQAAPYSQRNAFFVYDYGKNILKTIPRNGLLFIDGGDDTFYSLSYLLYAMGRRPDIGVYDRGGLVFKTIYGADFRLLAREQKQTRRQQVESGLIGKGVRTIYSTMSKNVLDGHNMVLRGFLMEPKALVEPGFDGSIFWNFYSLRNIYEPNIGGWYYRLRALLPYYDYMRALDLAGSIDMLEESLAYFRKAAYTGWDVGWLEDNIKIELQRKGYDYYSSGQFDAAEKIYIFLMGIYPRDPRAYVNLGAIYENRGDLGRAYKYYISAIDIDFDNVDAHFNLAVLYWQQGRWAEVVKEFEIVESLSPGYRDAPRFLAAARQELYKKQFGK